MAEAAADPHGALHPRLRPRFPFFAHRTLAEVHEAAYLEARAAAGRIHPYEMIRLRELQQRRPA